MPGVQTPPDVLARLVSEDSSKPALTYYDDTPGPTQGERIEISRRVLDTWVAKAANALQEGLDVHPGSVVLLDLPAPHWRTAYWALAVWSVGATLTLDDHEGADVLVTSDPNSPAVEDSDEVVVVTLAGLAREYPGELRTGVMDEARELASFGDSFDAWDEVEADDVGLVHQGERTAYEALVPTPTWSRESRVLITTTDRAAFLTQLMHALTVHGSAVLVRGGAVSSSDPRLAQEGVTQHA